MFFFVLISVKFNISPHFKEKSVFSVCCGNHQRKHNAESFETYIEEKEPSPLTQKENEKPTPPRILYLSSFLSRHFHLKTKTTKIISKKKKVEDMNNLNFHVKLTTTEVNSCLLRLRLFFLDICLLLLLLLHTMTWHKHSYIDLHCLFVL